MVNGDELDIGCLVIDPGNVATLYNHFRGDGLGDIEARQRIRQLDSAIEAYAVNEYLASFSSGKGVVFLKDLEDSLEIREMTTAHPIAPHKKPKRAQVPTNSASALMNYESTRRDQFEIV